MKFELCLMGRVYIGLDEHQYNCVVACNSTHTEDSPLASRIFDEGTESVFEKWLPELDKLFFLGDEWAVTIPMVVAHDPTSIVFLTPVSDEAMDELIPKLLRHDLGENWRKLLGEEK